MFGDFCVPGETGGFLLTQFLPYKYLYSFRVLQGIVLGTGFRIKLQKSEFECAKSYQLWYNKGPQICYLFEISCILEIIEETGLLSYQYCMRQLTFSIPYYRLTLRISYSFYVFKIYRQQYHQFDLLTYLLPQKSAILSQKLKPSFS